MSEERLFKRKAFGGFDREDVIEYIDKILAELKSSREELERKDARIAELEKKIDEYETVAAQPPVPVECDSPEEVLSQVDLILQNYLNRED